MNVVLITSIKVENKPHHLGSTPGMSTFQSSHGEDVASSVSGAVNGVKG